MDLVTGDRQIPNSPDFPENITPFPATPNILFSNQTPLLQPQKLRPIRGNSMPNDVLPLQIEDLGVCEFSKECFVKEEEVDDVAVDSWVSHKRDPGMNLYDCGSSSSSDDDSLLMAIEDSDERKRKRKRRKKIEEFLESFAKRVMENQEQMHQQLMDIIEKRERERIMREDAWKQKEIERIKSEEKIRKQETSRSLAMISFIQNLLGHKSESLQSSTTRQSEDNGSEHVGSSHILRDVECEETDANNKRWADVEVQALIMLRAAREQGLQGSKGPNAWDEISAGMSHMGYNRTAKKCKEKWENMKKYNNKWFRNGGLKQHGNGVSPFFQESYLQNSDLCENGTRMD